MAQVINDPGRWAGLGAGFGAGLGQGLQQLTQQKLKDIQDRKTQGENYKVLRNYFSEEQAQDFKALPQPILMKLMEQFGNLQQRQGGQGGIQNLQQQPADTGQADRVNQIQSMLSGLQQETQPQDNMQQQLASLLGQQQASPQDLASRVLGEQPIDQTVANAIGSPPDDYQQFYQDDLQKQAANEQQQELLQQVQQQVQQQQQQQQQVQQQQVPKQQVDTSGMSLRRRNALSNQQYRDDRLSQKDKAMRLNDSRKYREAMGDNEDFLFEERLNLHSMRDMNRAGELQEGKVNEVLGKLGLDLNLFKNDESQAFVKMQTSFAKNAKKYFGGRITNFEIQTLLKLIPSLKQSRVAREIVGNGLLLINESKQAEIDSLNEIMKENNGVPPLGIRQMVKERTSDKRDEIAKRYGDLIVSSKLNISHDPVKNKEKIIRGTDSGSRFRSDGTNWLRIQ